MYKSPTLSPILNSPSPTFLILMKVVLYSLLSKRWSMPRIKNLDLPSFLIPDITANNPQTNNTIAAIALVQSIFSIVIKSNLLLKKKRYLTIYRVSVFRFHMTQKTVMRCIRYCTGSRHTHTGVRVIKLQYSGADDKRT